jgi:Ca-activated chloride channel family protein
VKYLAFAWAVLATAAGATAQQAHPSDHTAAATQAPPAVFRSGANLVAINVTVTDGKRFVSGLSPADFAVYEDGVQQEVRFFEAAKVPVDLILLIDTSSSMRSKMPLVQEAARGFMKTLRVGDRGAVVEFNDTFTVSQALTGDLGAIEAAIDRSAASGGTALNNALYIAIKQFGRSARGVEDIRRQAIAVLSDGQDTASLLSFDDVLGQARRSGVNIYTIALKSPGQSVGPDGRPFVSESDYALKTLARETGAQAFFPGTAGELKGIYAEIAEELSSQYSIGYAPTNISPGLMPRARSGYLSGSASASARPVDGR